MSQLQRLAIAAEQIQGSQIVLSAEQQHYLSRVLRLNRGDRFIALDPLGRWWLSQLVFDGGEIVEQIPAATELPGEIALIAAMPKSSGFENIVRQTVQLGVTNIYPVWSDRTLLQPSPQKLQRWRRIAREAAEQSQRQLVPTIFEPLSFANALLEVAKNQQSATSRQNYICVPSCDCPHLLECLFNWASNWEHLPRIDSTAIAIATGPEGGWTEAEVERAIAAGFSAVSLGKRILRAITAPVVALSLAAAVLEMTGGSGKLGDCGIHQTMNDRR